ncbi:hypothetical protein [Edaphobacter flagellatus]|uniref:hypothetical protein n=1 Tax=Edaphobacter flagellatus TaxID=1933044 RepID=UPI0021B20F5A|nr:hypothetical protein [Edaphobacter flagellatus]
MSYNRAMRRILAILLLLIPGLPLVSPLLMAADGPDASLPACCRRNGSHHCAATSGAPDTSATPHVRVLPQRCPSYPSVTVSPLQSGAAVLTSSLRLARYSEPEIVAHESSIGLLAAHDRSHRERGPPALALL